MDDRVREEMKAAQLSPEFEAKLLERIAADDVWKLDANAQAERLKRGYLVIDGELAEMKAVGPAFTTKIDVPVLISSVGDQPVGIYTLFDNPRRFYVFGKAEVRPDGPMVENALIEITADVCVVADRVIPGEPAWPTEVSSRDVWALPGEERRGYFRNLPGNIRVLLDRWLAEACLINAGPGSSGGDPAGDITFRNVGEHHLTVYRHRLPRHGYYVFGEAEIRPFGLRVKDTIVALEPRVVKEEQ